MFSQRFQKPVILTRHAVIRTAERHISMVELQDVIDTGDTRYADATHLWAYKTLPARQDNLVCAVLVLEDALVVKTVMHHFEVV